MELEQEWDQAELKDPIIAKNKGLWFFTKG